MRELVRVLTAAVLLILLSAASPAPVIDDEKDEFIERFYEHLQTVYLEPLWDNGYDTITDGELMASVLGYALGQQLKYVKANTREHEQWKAVERQVQSDVDDLVARKAANAGLSRLQKEQLHLQYYNHMRAGLLGEIDERMEEVTGVAPGSAPSIFTKPEGEITVTGLRGNWKFMRGDWDRSYYPGQHKDIELSDSIIGGGYEVRSPPDTTMFYWKLNGKRIEIYNANGQLSYTFDRRSKIGDLEIWEGRYYFRGEIYEEVGDEVEYYLTRRN
jgi:hypothetical protein